MNNTALGDVMSRVGRMVGERVLALYQSANRDWPDIRQRLDLSDDTQPLDFWESVWQVFGTRLAEMATDTAGPQSAIGKALWADDGLARLLHVDALPTGLPGDYRTLASLATVPWRTGGLLDDDQVFDAIADWREVRAKLPPGAIISTKRIALPLEKLGRSLSAKPVRLADVIQLVAPANSEITPELAGRLGSVVTCQWLHDRASSNATQPYGRSAHDEDEDLHQIRNLLETYRFQTVAGRARGAADLLIGHDDTDDSTVDVDERLFAAFAPDDRVLAPAYAGPALKFFLACRRQFTITPIQLASWATEATSEAKRRAVLRCLLSGKHELAKALKFSYPDSWLTRLVPDDNLLEEFNEDERRWLLAMLGTSEKFNQSSSVAELSSRNGTSVGPSLRIDAKSALRRIVDWWNREGKSHRDQYERRIYPDGRPPVLAADVAGSHNNRARRDWIELLLLGATHRLGRFQHEQHREFLRLCRKRGWLDALSKPNLSGDELSRIVRDYCEQPDGQKYYHWLQLLVPLYVCSHWLVDYVELFRSLDHRQHLHLSTALNSRSDPYHQGGGINAPSLLGVLGFGANFVVRELVRQGFLNSHNVTQYCYVPTKRLRQLLNVLGCNLREDRGFIEDGPKIAQFLKDHCDDPTFGGDFDLPLQILVGSNHLPNDILEVDWKPLPDDDLGDEL